MTLAPFAGAVQSSSGAKPLPLAAQVIEAVAAASFAATLIILAALLTRRHAWVRTVQIGTLVTQIALAADLRGGARGRRATAPDCPGSSAR